MALGCAICIAVVPFVTAGESVHILEEVTVIGTALNGRSLNLSAVPSAAQRFTGDDLADRSYFSAVTLLESRAASVSSNAAQNNRLQPDLQYRGFTASPLLGVSQGLAVYQNGVRINEAFGDTVNWDLWPASSVAQLDLVGGSNPVYGLNTIGGAIAITTHTGFRAPGAELSYTIGDFGVRDSTLQLGTTRDEWGFFIALDSMKEDGWRDFSDSKASTLYTSLSWRAEQSEADFFFNFGDSRLKGNGATPIDLLTENRSAVFTHPDQTKNKLAMASLSFRHTFSNNLALSTNIFYRDLETFSFNGDGAVYEECGEDSVDGDAHPFEGFLCSDEDDPATDRSGVWVVEEFNGVNNRSWRSQSSHGFTAQLIGETTLGNAQHNFLMGVDYFRGDTTFNSTVEYAQLTNTRGTTLSGRFDSDGDTNLDTDLETWSLFFSDNLVLNPALSMMLSVRANATSSIGLDPTGQRPELAGNHTFTNTNAGAGLLYQLSTSMAWYANAQSSTRIPTPVELACSHPAAPCTLPNTFLADPPLDQVASISYEVGVRGSGALLQHYRLGGFLINANDDIVFQTTGGVSSNQGFFQNAADTRRLGIELELAGNSGVWQWYLNYTWMEANYQSDFYTSSPNNPASINDKLRVTKGRDIPLIPNHNLKLGVSASLTNWLNLGLDYRYQTGVHLRGDEANLDAKTDSWRVVDLYARATLGEHWYIEARLDNALDEEYETFGLYGEASEVLSNVENESGRFLGPSMPRFWWLTVGWTF